MRNPRLLLSREYHPPWGTFMLRPIALATFVAGTLDILAAIGLTLNYGRAVPEMLRYVASGPMPWATGWGTAGAILGLVVHFALIAVMVVAFFWAAERWPSLAISPIRGAIIYGLITYVAMNLIIVPLRFGTFPHSLRPVLTQLFCHIVLVGLPLALIAARTLTRERAVGA